MSLLTISVHKSQIFLGKKVTSNLTISSANQVVGSPAAKCEDTTYKPPTTANVKLHVCMCVNGRERVLKNYGTLVCAILGSLYGTVFLECHSPISKEPYLIFTYVISLKTLHF